jgi:hypothetical protein
MDWAEVLRYASAAGALCCTKAGARLGLTSYTNPKKLLHESPHPGLLPLEKVTMRTYWDWYYMEHWELFKQGLLDIN